jgi:ankyrin repeat protein
MDHGAIPTDKTVDLLMKNITDEKYGMLRRILKTSDNTQSIDKAVQDAFLGDSESVQKSITDSTNRELALHGIAAFCNVDSFKNVITDSDDVSDLLVTAVKYSNADTVKYILDTYKDIDAKGPMNKTILYYASEHDNIEILKALNESNITIDKFWGAESAIENEKTVAFQWLLDNGLDKGQYNYLLEFACLYGNYDIAKLLLDNGTDANGGDILKLLIDYGADINYISPETESALMVAVDYGQLDCVKLLVENGADLNYTYDGKSVIDVAYEHGSQRIYDYLAELL